MAVQWKVNVTTILLIVAILLFIVFGDSFCNRPRIESNLNLYNAIQWLKTHAYQPAERVTEPKPDNLSPPVREGSTSTTSGQGYWIPESEYEPGDSVGVELSVVVLEDESAWVKVTIDSVEVKWHRLEHYQRDIQRRWRLHLEITNNNGDIGAGVGYKLFTVLGSDIVPSASVSTSLDWIAPEIIVSRNLFSGVSAGVGCGFRFGEGDGLHLSGLVSIEL